MNYRKFREKENRAKLFGVIRKNVDFLTDDEIREIVEKIDVNKKYSIIVVNNPEEMANEYLKFIKYAGFEHSWAGEEYERTEVLEVLYGEAVLGNYYSYQYYNNGNLSNEEFEEIEPDFDIEKPLVVLHTKIYFSNYNGRYENDERNYLVFYKRS